MSQAFRFSFWGSLIVSVASFAYLYLAPERFHPLVVIGSPVAVVALALSARWLSSRHHPVG